MAQTHVDLTTPTTLVRMKTIVCVTDQKNCDRIIRSGKLLADMTGTDLAVVTVARPNAPQDPEAVEYLFSVAKEQEAEMAILYAEDIGRALIRYVKQNKVAYLLTGIPREGDSVTTQLWNKFTHVSFFVVEKSGELREVGNSVRAARALCAQ